MSFQSGKGKEKRFQTTHWSEIIRAQTDDETQRREALEQILSRYWGPIYSYLRRKGYDPEAAQDLAQGFIEEVVLGRSLVQNADKERGKFRTFLLRALDRYAISDLRKTTARKRRPEGGIASLDTPEGLDDFEPADTDTPEDAFNRAWASALLDKVLEEVEQECCEKDQKVYWHVFQARVAGPILERTEPPPLAVLCREYHIPDAAKASNMIITVKRRFQAALRSHVRLVVSSDEEIESEILDLMQVLS